MSASRKRGKAKLDGSFRRAIGLVGHGRRAFSSSALGFNGHDAVQKSNISPRELRTKPSNAMSVPLGQLFDDDIAAFAGVDKRVDLGQVPVEVNIDDGAAHRDDNAVFRRLMVPGPAMRGIASGKIDGSLSGSRWSLVLPSRRDCRRSKSISSAVKNSSAPPAMRNAGMEIPTKSRSAVPKIAKRSAR
jgi:hypothetical protein